MRLFCGLDLTAGVRHELGDLVRKLRPAARIRWSPVENLHITTKFIGEWPADRVERIQQALASLPAREPIPVRIRGLGWFPNPHNPRVFWAGIDAPPALAELARATGAALAAIGVPPETRPFSPHLTLARISAPAPLAGLRQHVAALDSTDFGAFVSESFFLYLSERSPGGSAYTKLAEFPLHKP
ncbi:MAG: RNA 2',3'-cyclic phosphodiesterase [Acidobacteria bacterium]|nr:RNA 2',3'-cyclic phosphodiesterase [Acidobacteriota bacterium]